MDGERKLLKGTVLVLAFAVLATLVDGAFTRHRAGALAHPRTLRVTAMAFAEAEPDVAHISLGMKAVRPTPEQAAAAVAETVSATKAALQGLGVSSDAIETSELYLGEALEYDFKKGEYVR